MRVTKPGGRVVVIAFGAPQRAEFLTFFIGAMQVTVPGFTPLPMDPPPLPFQLADPEKLRRHLVRAGLNEVQVETTTWDMHFESVTDFWNLVTSSNPLGA